CRWLTTALGEFYMVHDHVWEQACQVSPRAIPRFLCIGCLEERLGRMLTPDDFKDCLLNDPDKPQGASSRLRKRLTGKAPLSSLAASGGGEVQELLLDGARYWREKGISPDTSIITVWSSGSSHWSLRSTIGEAAKLTVKSDKLGKPVLQRR